MKLVVTFNKGGATQFAQAFFRATEGKSEFIIYKNDHLLTCEGVLTDSVPQAGTVQTNSYSYHNHTAESLTTIASVDDDISRSKKDN